MSVILAIFTISFLKSGLFDTLSQIYFYLVVICLVPVLMFMVVARASLVTKEAVMFWTSGKKGKRNYVLKIHRELKI